MVNTTTANTDYTGARLVVSNTSNSYLEVRSTAGQSSIVLTTATSTTSNFPTVEIFNSANFGIVAYRPGVVSSNYVIYYALGSSTNRSLEFQTEGTARIFINQGGNVSIGSTNNTYKLDVNGTGNFTGALSGTSATFSGNVLINGATIPLKIQRSSTSGQEAAIRYNTAGTDYFYAGLADGSNNYRLYNVTTGNNDFVISASTGAATFSNDIQGGGDLYFNKATRTTIYPTTTNQNLHIKSNGTGTLQFNDDVTGNIAMVVGGGKVGIGTASPQVKLHIYENSNSAIYTLNQNPSAGTSAWSGFVSQNNNNGYLYLQTVGSNYTGTDYGNHALVGQQGLATLAIYSDTDLRFRTGGTVASNERMRITSGGAVLIGTTSDAGTGILQVSGRLIANTINRAKGNTGSMAHSTWVNMFSVTDIGMYLVNARLNAGAGSTANYTAFATVIYDGVNSRIVTNNGNLLQLQLSGNTVQVLQGSGATQGSGVTWAYTIVAAND